MSSQPLNLLLVEDDPMVRRLLVRHFQKDGNTVTEAPDAEQALVQFGAAASSFDVVITDVHLPAMTGVDMATHILWSEHVYVIHDGEEDVVNAMLPSLALMHNLPH